MRLRGILAGVERLGVAFSGGVDSSVVLALAARVLGPERVVALLGVSPSLAADERAGAHAIARDLGVRVVEVPTRELDRAEYRANGPDRCFHCKDELFSTIDAEIVRSERLDAVAYGENADDARRPDRPGGRAASEHRVLRPLADMTLSKADVRRIAGELGLACADKPAAPCLASRIPHFAEVTEEKLRQIEQAEAALRRLGFQDFRVRHHGDIARIELPEADLVRAVSEPLRTSVRAAVLAAGFRFAAVDLAGIQSGAFTLPLVTPPLTAPARSALVPAPVRPRSVGPAVVGPTPVKAAAAEPAAAGPTPVRPAAVGPAAGRADAAESQGWVARG